MVLQKRLIKNNNSVFFFSFIIPFIFGFMRKDYMHTIFVVEKKQLSITILLLYSLYIEIINVWVLEEKKTCKKEYMAQSFSMCLNETFPLKNWYI